MRFTTRQTLSISVAMLTSIGLAWAIAPHIMLAHQRARSHLNTILPMQFGDWRAEKSTARIVSPELKATVRRIYSQTLARIYVNRSNEMIMLSVAYGRDQDGELHVHLPQDCYRSQGFAISNVSQHKLATPYGTIPVSRMVATLGTRVEPVTYWVVIGNKATDTQWTMRKAELAYAMIRVIPDGMLVRVSTIARDPRKAYALEQQFTDAMMLAIPRGDRGRFFGTQE